MSVGSGARRDLDDGSTSRSRAAATVIVAATGVAVAIALLAAGGCIPESNDSGASTNSITVVNASDDVLVWVRAPDGLSLDEALDRNVAVPPIVPGDRLNRGLGERTAQNRYCSPDQQWILAPLDPSRFGPTSLSRGFSAADFVLVDQREAGYCWGQEPSATWRIGD